MKRKIRRFLTRLPLLGGIATRAIHAWRFWTFPGSEKYWESRYATGGTSGPGSYDELARFKARVLNAFVSERGVRSVIEFGCGDGAQLALASYPTYVGLDVSRTAIGLCRHRFESDLSKSFFLYDPHCFVDRSGLFCADLALSLDVIYHLVEDEIFELHIRHLFGAARRYVVVYSSDRGEPSTAPYVRHRRFAEWVARELPGWALEKRLPNERPFSGNYAAGSWSEFFFFERRQ